MGLFTLYSFHIFHPTHWKPKKKLYIFFALNLQKNSKELNNIRKICYIYQMFTISIVFPSFLVIALVWRIAFRKYLWNNLFNINCFSCPSSENVIILLLSLRNIITKCKIIDLWVSFLQSFKTLSHLCELHNIWWEICSHFAHCSPIGYRLFFFSRCFKIVSFQNIVKQSSFN